MIRRTPPLQRRRHSNHSVTKYLEGVPPPQKIVDRIAGADLRSSSSVHFYSTVPRYIDAGREQRLSSLFFHHVLYPAGARSPCQAVIVRGSRGLRRSVYALPVRDSALNTSNSSSDEPSLLRAPALGKTYDPSSILNSAEVSEAMWAAFDPARVPFFYSAREKKAGRRADEPPKSMKWTLEDINRSPAAPPRWRTHVSPSFSETSTLRQGTERPSAHSSASSSSTRAKCFDDSSLALLAGTIEHYFNHSASSADVRISAHPETSQEIKSLLRRVWKHLVPQHAGIIYFKRNEFDQPEEVCGTTAGMVLSDVLKDWKRRSLGRVGGVSHQYMRPAAGHVMLQLPEAAVVRLTMPDSDGDGVRQVCRLSGGWEPFVPFAVGRPKSSMHGTGAGLAQTLFPHIHVLARLELSARQKTNSSAVSGTSERQRGKQKEMKQGLDNTVLGVPLDPLLPIRSRRVVEKTLPNASLGGSTSVRAAIGCVDAEMYFIPRRELQLTLIVPHSVEERCHRQNQQRVEKQVRLGYTSSGTSDSSSSMSTSAVWATAGKFTSTKAVLHQHLVANTGNGEGRRLPSGHLSYDVTALPGDVVYIPCGWGLEVKRHLGSRLIRDGSECQIGVPAAANATTEKKSTSEQSETIQSVEIDGFFVLYKPYPILSEDQAAVYMSANYVQAGITEFYEKGGNNVYHRYA